MDWLFGPREYEVDSVLFPYYKLSRKVWTCFYPESQIIVDNRCPIQKSSTNYVGSCLLVVLGVLIQSAPYFLLDVHYHHKNDNWNEIIDVVDQVISRPDIKTKLPETFAGNYLAMEL
ncbi:hypothetical protein SNEBB_000229, partial [Seison nebaliae]